MATETQTRQLGDTRIALACELKRPDGTAVDLSGLSVKFAMYDRDGDAKVAETTDNVTVVDATAGKVKYTFQAADVDTAGMFFAYFIVVESSKDDTFPATRGKMRVDIQRPAFTE